MYPPPAVSFIGWGCYISCLSDKKAETTVPGLLLLSTAGRPLGIWPRSLCRIQGLPTRTYVLIYRFVFLASWLTIVSHRERYVTEKKSVCFFKGFPRKSRKKLPCASSKAFLEIGSVGWGTYLTYQGIDSTYLGARYRDMSYKKKRFFSSGVNQGTPTCL